MDTNEQTSSVNNSSALGETFVLTPSQRREQERLRKEKEAKEAAKKRKIDEAKMKKERRMIAKLSFYFVMFVISSVCGLVWCIYGAVHQYNEFLVFGMFILLILTSIYNGAKFFELYKK